MDQKGGWGEEWQVLSSFCMNCEKLMFSPHRWMNTDDIPRDRAMEQACWPPAPPKQAKTWREVSWPLASVSALIGRHMVSLATVMNPIATCSTVKGSFFAPSSWEARNSFTWSRKQIKLAEEIEPFKWNNNPMAVDSNLILHTILYEK